ncbi:hypothetical protein Emag_005337 [Eimeria magna]
MQTVCAEDQGVGDAGYKEISFGLCVFVAPPVVRDILRNRAHLERRAVPRQEARSLPVHSFVNLLHSEDQTSWGAFFSAGLLSSVCTPLSDCLPSLGSSRFGQDLRVTDPLGGAGMADAVGGALLARGVFSSRRVSRNGVVRRLVGILDTYGPRHPRLPCGRFADYYHLHTLFPSGRSPAYEPSGSLAPSVSSSVALEEERARGSEDDEPDPSSPVMSSASTPSTSVGGSPPGDSSPREAPEALEPLEPPRRRRCLEPQSAPSPAAP